MFDPLKPKFKKIILNLSFKNDVQPYIVKQSINAPSISGRHKVSKNISQKTFKTNTDLCDSITNAEKNYKKFTSSFLSINHQKFYELPEKLNIEEIQYSLIDGYDYFYKQFIRHKYQPKNKMTCLICSNELGNHWDHIIPKSRYPIFSLTPVNLVMICGRCNTKKGKKFNFNEDLPYHPMFDSINLDYDIKAKLDLASIHKKNGEGLTVYYQTSRIKNLIQLYDLDEIIISRCFDELAEFVGDFCDGDNNDVESFRNCYLNSIKHTKHNTVQRIISELISKLSKKELIDLMSDEVKEFLDII